MHLGCYWKVCQELSKSVGREYRVAKPVYLCTFIEVIVLVDTMRHLPSTHTHNIKMMSQFRNPLYLASSPHITTDLTSVPVNTFTFFVCLLTWRQVSLSIMDYSMNSRGIKCNICNTWCAIFNIYVAFNELHLTLISSIR